MFILILKYKKSIERIEQLLPAHVEFLNKYYQKENFIVSGRQNPRTGGIILAKAGDLNAIWKIIEEDPFYQDAAAEYEVIEFNPSKYNEKFEPFV